MDQKVSATASADWTRTSQDKPMLVNAKMDSWVVVYPQRLERETDNFVRVMMQVANKMRFQIPQPQLEPVDRDNAMDLVKAVEKIVSRSEPGKLNI